MPSEPTIPALLAVARDAARSAGSVIREIVLAPGDISLKGPANPVTIADLRAEKIVVEAIRGAFPDHDFLTEEAGDRRTGADYTWIIDPLDGTTNFSRDIPLFCVSVAVARGGRLLAGAIYDPLRHELFDAALGMGARLNNEPIRVSEAKPLRDCVVYFEPSWRKERHADYASLPELLTRVSNIRVLGSAALDLAHAAAGRADLAFHYSMSPWDVAAGSLIVEEAGGEVTDWGNRRDPFSVSGVVAGNPAICREFLALAAAVR